MRIRFCLAALFSLFSVISAEKLPIWIMPNGASPKEELEQELVEFKRQTGIETEVTVLDWGEAWNRISTALEKGKGLPAVLQLGSSWVAHFAATGTLLPLNPWLDKIDPSRFVETSFQTSHVYGDSTIYAIPWFVDMRTLLANKRILKEAGITAKDISTYEGFLESLEKINAKKMSLEDGTPVRAYAFPGKSDWNIPHNFAPWIWSAGGDFVKIENEKAKASLLEPQTVEGIARYLNFVLSGAVNRFCLQQNTVQITQRFNRGELAFILNTAEIIMQIRFAGADGGLRHSPIGMDGVEAYPVPAGTAGSVSFVGGSNLAIPAKYPNKKAAAKLLLFLTDNERINDYTRHIGFLPPVKPVLQSWETDSSYLPLVKNLDNARAYLAIPEWSEVESILVETFSEIWSVIEFEGLFSEASIYEILKKGNARINALLKVEDETNLSLEQFKTAWKKAIPEKKKSPTPPDTQKATTKEAISPSMMNITIGLFVIFLIIGFAFAYRRKR